MSAAFHDSDAPLDLAIVGGGPCGLSCGIEAARRGMSYRVFEKKGIAASIQRFPVGMPFFSTPEKLELGGIPLTCAGMRPTREEMLRYVHRIVEHFAIDVALYTPVERIEPGAAGGFRVHTPRGTVAARNVVVATGYYDRPNSLDVPGIDLPHVRRYYDERFRYAGCDVVVVGGGNSAIEAALDLLRGGARVRLVHRRASLKPTIKYWVLPDIEKRIEEGAIPVEFETEVRSISEGCVSLGRVGESATRDVRADFVLALIGYRPEVDLLVEAGVEVDPETLEPRRDERTFETNVPGLYVGGSVVSGRYTSRIFIENGRFHARDLVAAVARRVEAMR